MIIQATVVSKSVKSADSEELVILDKINLSIETGETIAIVGASGSGKSTLLGLLAGLDVPSTGQIILNNNDLTAMDEEGRAKVRAENVGFVFQSFQLLPGLNALENVMMPLELRGIANAAKKAKDYLTDVGLEKRFRHYPKQLSGGEQQRVAIARAFASNPRVLFADEPTGNLDTKTGSQIIDLLFNMNIAQGTTLVLVTHDQRLASRCQRQIVLEAGRLLSSDYVNTSAARA